MKEADNHKPLIKKIIKSLLSIFTLKYSPSVHKRRKYIMYMIVSLLVDNVTLNMEMIKEKTKEQVVVISTKINFIYKQIKKNEHLPDIKLTNLLKNDKPSNLENTIKKIEAMNHFNQTHTPRI